MGFGIRGEMRSSTITFNSLCGVSKALENILRVSYLLTEYHFDKSKIPDFKHLRFARYFRLLFAFNKLTR